MLAMAKAHILVVDDDRSIVKVVRSYLEQAGYDVSTALDGEHALHLLRSERPDLMDAGATRAACWLAPGRN